MIDFLHKHCYLNIILHETHYGSIYRQVNKPQGLFNIQNLTCGIINIISPFQTEPDAGSPCGKVEVS